MAIPQYNVKVKMAPKQATVNWKWNKKWKELNSNLKMKSETEQWESENGKLR